MNSKTGKILFVDDDTAIRESAKYFLEKAGHSVICGRNGDEALRFFKRGAFDLAIIDLIMPGKDGLETIVEMRKTDDDLRVIAISGSDMNEARESLNGMQTLDKPFSRAQLMECVAGQLARRKGGGRHEKTGAHY